MIRNFAHISNISFTRIQRLSKNVIAMEFKRVKYLKTFDLQPFILSIMDNYSPVLKMLLPTYRKKLTRTVYDYLARTYLLMIITMSTQYNHRTVGELAVRLKKDKAIIKDLFTGQLSAKEIDEGCKYIAIMEAIFRDDPMGITQLMYPLSVKLDEDFNDNCIVS